MDNHSNYMTVLKWLFHDEHINHVPASKRLLDWVEKAYSFIFSIFSFPAKISIYFHLGLKMNK